MFARQMDSILSTTLCTLRRQERGCSTPSMRARNAESQAFGRYRAPVGPTGSKFAPCQQSCRRLKALACPEPRLSPSKGTPKDSRASRRDMKDISHLVIPHLLAAGEHRLGKRLLAGRVAGWQSRGTGRRLRGRAWPRRQLSRAALFREVGLIPLGIRKSQMTLEIRNYLSFTLQGESLLASGLPPA
jgi:hypothetical protein